MGREIVGWILRTSPVWGVAINAGIACITAKEEVRGGSHARSIAALVGYIVILVLLTAYYLLA